MTVADDFQNMTVSKDATEGKREPFNTTTVMQSELTVYVTQNYIIHGSKGGNKQNKKQSAVWE